LPRLLFWLWPPGLLLLDEFALGFQHALLFVDQGTPGREFGCLLADNPGNLCRAEFAGGDFRSPGSGECEAGCQQIARHDCARPKRRTAVAPG